MSEVFKEALEHPEGLLVDLNPTNDKVLRFKIPSFFTVATEILGVLEEDFMAIDEVGHKILSRCRFCGQFGDPREISQLFESAG